MKSTYKDIVFRSRLESAWARYFDSKQLPWLYEPQTFREGRFSYTPDFRIDQAGSSSLWVEVKGRTIPMNRSLRLCPRPLIVLFGTPAHHYAILITESAVRHPYWEAALLALGATYDLRY